MESILKGVCIMKTKEELNELKAEVLKLSEKLQELSEDELNEVSGGMKIVVIKSSADSLGFGAPESFSAMPEKREDEKYVL